MLRIIDRRPIRLCLNSFRNNAVPGTSIIIIIDGHLFFWLMYLLNDILNEMASLRLFAL